MSENKEWRTAWLLFCSTGEYFFGEPGVAPDIIILNLEDCRCRSIASVCHHHLELGRLQVASDLRAEARENVDFRDADSAARVRFRPRGDPVGDACTACLCRHGRFRLSAGIWEQWLQLLRARDVKAGQVILLGPIDDAACSLLGMPSQGLRSEDQVASIVLDSESAVCNRGGKFVLDTAPGTRS